MKKTIILIFVLLILTAGFILIKGSTSDIDNEISVDTNTTEIENEEVKVLIEELEIPWDLAFLPSGNILITERSGDILMFSESGRQLEEVSISSVSHRGEGGLLGIALHPDFESNNYVYLYKTSENEAGLINKVDRYSIVNNSFIFNKNIIDDIPGAPYHDGGRLEFGPDGFLYITVGDATDIDLAQDINSVAGSILRVDDEGNIPEDNPYGNAVWSYGHRNPQGIAWDSEGRLWSTEHGRSGIRSGFDEINLIQRGGNYGWPNSQGDAVLEETTGPVLHSGSGDTWAPASALYWDGSIFFGGLRGQALYEAVLAGEEIIELKEHFKEEFGRIRTVRLGPDGMFYLTTSNRDGRGTVNEGDDKIIRINPQQFR